MFLDTIYFVEEYGDRIKKEGLSLDQVGAWTYWWMHGQKEGCYPNGFSALNTEGTLYVSLCKPPRAIEYPDWALIIGENPVELHQPSESIERYCYWEPFTRDREQVTQIVKGLFGERVKIRFDFSK